MKYVEYQLPDSEIEYVKKLNLYKGVDKYIKENGTEPSDEIAKSFYTATDEEIEAHRRLMYTLIFETTPSPEPPTPHDYSKDYLTFNITSDGTIMWNSPDEYPIFYSKNDGITWENMPLSLNVETGDKIVLKGNKSESYSSFIGSTCGFVLEGNIMSLLYGDEFIGKTVLEKKFEFSGMFSYCLGLTSAKNLILPATTLTVNCYNAMFEGCTNLTTSPELPATTLAESCYAYMFDGCTNLTTAPELPATTLADYCYRKMFHGCTGLTSVRELPATTLANNCYNSMFHDCTSLTTAPELPATTLAESCYAYMFASCTSLDTAPELPATTLTSFCYGSMFYNCTSLTTAPELPATTLVSSCYSSMFAGCTSLTTAPELPATTLASSCYSSMFEGCTSLTTAPELPATTLANRCYVYMFNGCTNLTTAPELPATTLADGCYNFMFQSCNNLNYVKCLATTNISIYNTRNWLYYVSGVGTFVKSAGVTWSRDTSGIPSGWTVQEV